MSRASFWRRGATGFRVARLLGPFRPRAGSSLRGDPLLRLLLFALLLVLLLRRTSVQLTIRAGLALRLRAEKIVGDFRGARGAFPGELAAPEVTVRGRPPVDRREQLELVDERLGTHVE